MKLKPATMAITHSWPFAVIALAFVLLTLPSWAALLETAPLTYDNIPFPVESPVHSGDVLRVTVERCNRSSGALSYTLSRTLTNTESKETWALPMGGSDIPPGCQAVQSRLNILPDDLPPGRYVLSAVSQVPGRFRTFAVSWRTQEFEVVP